jgi:hypothetical protein
MNEIRHFVPWLARRVFDNFFNKIFRVLTLPWRFAYKTALNDGHLPSWAVGTVIMFMVPMLVVTGYWAATGVAVSQRHYGPIIFWAVVYLVSMISITIAVEFQRYREEKQKLIQTIRGDE